MALETSQVGEQLLRALPVGGAVATDIVARQFMGLTLNEWFYVASIGYVLVQVWAVLYKTLKHKKEET